MTQWSKIIEDNWDAITDAMQKAAHDVGEGDGGSILRVELNADGTVDTYWTFEGITSAAVHEGTALRIADYYGGECWSEEWADIYDPVPVLEGRLHDVQDGIEA
ncbi:MAG: hypothetical protein IJ705_08170 [Oscillospiraceae bacterium]|nr:hypothetical protein [Oscillospiraceae bacterium]